MIRDKTMYDKFMFIPNDFEKSDSFFKSFFFLSNVGHCQFEPVNQDLIKVSIGLRNSGSKVAIFFAQEIKMINIDKYNYREASNITDHHSELKIIFKNS